MWAEKAAATRRREAETIEREHRKVDRAVKRHAKEAPPPKPAPAPRRQSDREKAKRYLERLNRKFDKLAPIDTGILGRGLTPKEVLRARELRNRAHDAYRRNKHRGGGRAREVADQIRAMLGPELSKLLPQLWYYR